MKRESRPLCTATNHPSHLRGVIGEQVSEKRIPPALHCNTSPFSPEGGYWWASEWRENPARFALQHITLLAWGGLLVSKWVKRESRPLCTATHHPSRLRGLLVSKWVKRESRPLCTATHHPSRLRGVIGEQVSEERIPPALHCNTSPFSPEGGYWWASEWRENPARFALQHITLLVWGRLLVSKWVKRESRPLCTATHHPSRLRGLLVSTWVKRESRPLRTATHHPSRLRGVIGEQVSEKRIPPALHCNTSPFSPEGGYWWASEWRENPARFALQHITLLVWGGLLVSKWVKRESRPLCTATYHPSRLRGVIDEQVSEERIPPALHCNTSPFSPEGVIGEQVSEERIPPALHCNTSPFSPEGAIGEQVSEDWRENPARFALQHITLLAWGGGGYWFISHFSGQQRYSLFLLLLLLLWLLLLLLLLLLL